MAAVDLSVCDACDLLNFSGTHDMSSKPSLTNVLIKSHQCWQPLTLFCYWDKEVFLSRILHGGHASPWSAQIFVFMWELNLVCSTAMEACYLGDHDEVQQKLLLVLAAQVLANFRNITCKWSAFLSQSLPSTWRRINPAGIMNMLVMRSTEQQK